MHVVTCYCVKFNCCMFLWYVWFCMFVCCMFRLLLTWRHQINKKIVPRVCQFIVLAYIKGIPFVYFWNHCRAVNLWYPASTTCTRYIDLLCIVLQLAITSIPFLKHWVFLSVFQSDIACHYPVPQAWFCLGLGCQPCRLTF